MAQISGLISVVIPSYNRPERLIRAVNSVLEQTYKNLEVIIIDDASDNKIHLRDLENSERVRVLYNDVNRGPCYSRNRGISEARGEYINFLDDDDILFSDKLEKQVKFFNDSKNQKLGMVTAHAIDERSGEVVEKYNRVQGNIYTSLLKSYAVSGIETMLFKTSIIKSLGGFDIELESSQEYDLLIRFAENHEVDYVDEILSKEFRSENQINTNFAKKISGAKYLFKKHDCRFRDKGLIFWFRSRVKLKILILRFYIGKIFGEKAYRLLLIN